MRRLFFGRGGQSVLDYTLLIGAVCLALVLLAMGLQGRLRERAKEVGPPYDIEHGRAYSVTYTESESVEEVADSFSVVDIEKQFSGTKEQTKAPDVGAKEDVGEIDKSGFNPWQDRWDEGITW